MSSSSSEHVDTYTDIEKKHDDSHMRELDKPRKPGLLPDHDESVSGIAAHDQFIKSIADQGGVTHNPLRDLSREQLIKNAAAFADKHGLSEDRELFVRAGLLAQSGETDLLDDEEKYWVAMETENKWKQPFQLYWLTIMCSMCAVVQGMDETVINGAQTYMWEAFNMDAVPNKEWIEGLVIGAPYLCCAVIGCALTSPLNSLFGRRGVIFISCFIAAACSIWESFTYSWAQMFGARFVLGLGIGPKSTTVPVMAAECVPAGVRGALVMMWQLWTAFGIMFGYVMDLAFQPTDGGISRDVGWRLMVGSSVVAPLLVMAQVYFVPESPRWLIGKNRYPEAYKALCILRNHKIQAARDLFYMSTLIDISEELNRGRSLLADVFMVGRNRRALYASQLVMFMQQFCGINVIAYFSSQIFLDSGFSEKQALVASWGFGMVNWVFALPAVFTIDTFGRRSLVLFTFPMMAIWLLFTGFVFWVPDATARVGLVALGIYIYCMFYSVGMGPVPMVYCSEVFPLHIRDTGMSLGTITLWGFNFILSLTWPALLKRLQPQGAFGYYAGWNVVGFLLAFFLMPETKGLTLEELDITFSTPTNHFIAYEVKWAPWNFRRHILRQKNLPEKPPLYDLY